VAIGVTSSPTGAAAKVQIAEEHIADIRDAAGVRSAVEISRPDAVVHLAGQSSAGHSFGHPLGTLEANTAGTWNVLEAVRVAAPRARVLCIGSSDAYGPQPAGVRITEDAALRPISPYGLSKALADTAATFYATEL